MNENPSKMLLNIGQFEISAFFSYLEDNPNAKEKIIFSINSNGIVGDPDELERFKAYLLKLHPDRKEIIQREEVLSNDPLRAPMEDQVVQIIADTLTPDDEKWWDEQPAIFAHQYLDPVSNKPRMEIFLNRIRRKEGLESQRGFKPITQNELNSKHLDVQSINLTHKKLTDPIVVIRYKREQSTCYMQLELKAINNLAQFDGNQVHFQVDLDQVYPALKHGNAELTPLGFYADVIFTNLIVELINMQTAVINLSSH